MSKESVATTKLRMVRFDVIRDMLDRDKYLKEIVKGYIEDTEEEKSDV